MRGIWSILTAFGRSISPGASWLLSGDESERDIPFGLIDQLLDHSVARGSWSGPHEAGAALLDVIGSAPGPAMLVVDDVHLVDPESLTALQFALRRLRSDPVLALFTSRREESSTLPPGLPRLAQARGALISLEGLTDADVLALAAAVDRTDLDRHAARRLRRHTAGNPLHLRALLRELGDDELRSDGPLPAPRSYALLVRRTLGELSFAAKSVAEAAAVLPDGSTVGQLAALVLAPGEPLRALQELFDARLVATVGGGPERSTTAWVRPIGGCCITAPAACSTARRPFVNWSQRRSARITILPGCFRTRPMSTYPPLAGVGPPRTCSMPRG